MLLLNLAARVCCAFSEAGGQHWRAVQKVKDNQSRDVVTELDLRLHGISEQFVAAQMPRCRLLSEEGRHDDVDAHGLLDGEWLIVDPLDGSNNLALGLPNYGYMAAHLLRGHIVGAVVVLPEHSRYIVLEAGQSLYSQPLPQGASGNNGTVYYAYPPQQGASERQARRPLQDLIDTRSAGLYRYGSACVGLYQMLCGTHMAFVGHGIRLWDAVAFLPLLASRGIEARYCIRGLTITLVTSVRLDFIEGAAQVLQDQQGLVLHEYLIDEPLKIDG